MLVVFLVTMCSLLFFKNALYYTIALLVISICMLRYLTLNVYLTTLTALILVIVYVGAIIILIGYICAVSPNLNLEPDFRYLFLVFFMLSILLIFFKQEVSSLSLTLSTITDFFYRTQGVFLFFILILMLFISLLIVTSQYSSPRGPFRCI